MWSGLDGLVRTARDSGFRGVYRYVGSSELLNVVSSKLSGNYAAGHNEDTCANDAEIMTVEICERACHDPARSLVSFAR